MFVCHDGELFPSDQKLFDASNRSFKWGDGVFETMKLLEGNLLLETLHFDRLFQSLRLLGILPKFSSDELLEKILALTKKNNCTRLARVRLAVYRKEDDSAGYVIEANPLSAEANS